VVNSAVLSSSGPTFSTPTPSPTAATPHVLVWAAVNIATEWLLLPLPLLLKFMFLLLL